MAASRPRFEATGHALVVWGIEIEDARQHRTTVRVRGPRAFALT
jgi:hypothetical protein